jgi:hypothetical protein
VRVDLRQRCCPEREVELSRCNVDFGPSLAGRTLSPPVGGEESPRGGNEDRQDGNDRDGEGVHEDQCAPRRNQPSEWPDDIQPQGGPKPSQSGGT